MENQVFVYLREHYKKHEAIVMPDDLEKLNLPRDYIIEGIFQFNSYLDRRRSA